MPLRHHRFPKSKTLFCWLFIASFLIVQGLSLVLDSEQFPVFAHSPTEVNLVQSSPNPTILVQQGKVLYDAGKFSEAVSVLQQAADAFKTQGDQLRQAMALSNLALAYQQLGLWTQAEQALTESLNLLKLSERVRTQGQPSERLQILAQTLDIQGRLQLSMGQAEQALNTWQQAATIYAQLGNKDGRNQSLINQAQSLQNLGFYTRACKISLTALGINNQECQISDAQLQTIKNQPDSLVTAVALRNLGDTLQLVGDLQQAENVLRLSLVIAQRLQSSPNISVIQLSLGNTLRAQRMLNSDQPMRETSEGALEFYQQAAENSTSPTLKIQAQLNQLSLRIENKQFSEVSVLLSEIESEIANLPPSRTAVYARINLAQSLMKLSTSERAQAAQLLAKAVEQAKQIGDQRATAYALGNLGELYEQTEQFKEARELTEQALLLAQTINAPDIAYRWQWQLGRLLRAQGNRQEAIASYTSAISTLQSLRQDLVSINPNVQFSFRESVEPIYRQLVGLLLQSPADEQNLAQARDVIESLQLAELVNFFREDCLIGTPIKIDQIDQQAAVIYPIVLRDRLEVVLSLPNAPLRHYSTSLPQAQVEAVLTQLRAAIDSRINDPNQRGEGTESDSKRGTLVPEQRDTECQRGIGVEERCNNLSAPQQYLPLAQQVYDWLIQPVERDIAASEIKTLVFVLDGPMLNLPMAILHDGQQFLVEKYAIAYTPGLQLLNSETLTRGRLSALKAGLSEASQGFPPLRWVEKELKDIQAEVPGELLLNQKFTTAAIQQEIDSVPFPVVHLATHGQFSSNEKDTFILTWDDRLNINQLNTLLRSREETGRSPIELLVLSACQTAAGDKRAALGLAGVAVNAGARSTLATLWYVSDAATAEVMTRFYQELKDTTITKAEALRRAQVSLLSRYQQQPSLWAAYVLVGNWR